MSVFAAVAQAETALRTPATERAMRTSMASDALADSAAGLERVLVCGAAAAELETLLEDGVRIENAGGGEPMAAAVYSALCADRFGDLDAILFAPAPGADAAEGAVNLRAVLDRSFHDARLIALLDGDAAEDARIAGAVDLVVRR